MITYSHSELVEIAYKWVLKNGSCGVAFKELKTGVTDEIPDVIGFGSGHSFLVEVKVSRSDFLSDSKKPFRLNPSRGMGLHRYYCCPEGLIDKSELPEGWGLICVDANGKARRTHRPTKPNPEYEDRSLPYYHTRNIDAELGLLYSVARRLFLRGRIDEIYEDLRERREERNAIINQQNQPTT